MIEIKRSAKKDRSGLIGRQKLEVLTAETVDGKFGPRLKLKTQIEGTEEWVHVFISPSEQRLGELCAALGLPKPAGTSFDEQELVGRVGVAILTLGEPTATGTQFLNVSQWVAGFGQAAKPAEPRKLSRNASGPTDPEIPF
jgi:hypothetical protein